jgi:F-type H+-transporting ATPase subunit a
MHGSFFLTRFLDQTFGGIEASAFQSIVGLSASDAAQQAAGVNNALALELLVVGGMIVFFLIVRMTLSVERPNPAQQVAEMVGEFTGGLGEQIIGHGYERYQAFVTCIFLFVLLNNLVGLIPGVPPPTVSPWVPLGLALPTFIYYNYQGFREQGFIGYLKHFCGPIWWMAWLLLPIELVSHLARIMSLTIRLYANMYASDMVTLGFFSLIPIGVPAIFLGLHAFVSVIQAFVFMLLTMIYISLATTHEH